LNAAPIVNGVATYSTTALAHSAITRSSPITPRHGEHWRDGLNAPPRSSRSPARMPQTSIRNFECLNPTRARLAFAVNLTGDGHRRPRQPDRFGRVFSTVPLLWETATLNRQRVPTPATLAGHDAEPRHTPATSPLIYYGDATYQSVTSAAASANDQRWRQPSASVTQFRNANHRAWQLGHLQRHRDGQWRERPPQTVRRQAQSRFFKYDYSTGRHDPPSLPVTLTGSGKHLHGDDPRAEPSASAAY